MILEFKVDVPSSVIVSRKIKLSGEGNRCHASHRSPLSWPPVGDKGLKCSSHDSTIVVPEALRICLKTTARAQRVASSGMRAWFALPEGRGPISRASRESGLCATWERPGGLRRQPSAGAPRAVSEGVYTSNIHPTYIQHPIQHGPENLVLQSACNVFRSQSRGPVASPSLN